MRIIHLILCGIALLVVQPAAAQSPAKQSEEKITVLGQRLKDFLGTYVASITQIGPTDQLAIGIGKSARRSSASTKARRTMSASA